MLGAAAQSVQDLREPVNDLERRRIVVVSGDLGLIVKYSRGIIDFGKKLIFDPADPTQFYQCF